jgi:hypothetical protein
MSRSLLALPLCCAVLVPSLGISADDLAGALKEGKTTLSFRLRHEQVDDDAFDNTANASTLRSRLSYTSGQWHGLDLIMEFDHVGQIGDDRFNDTRNGNTDFPTVVDPKGADLNQAALRYRHNDYSVVGGRQRIALDNHRFIGTVGWRQNEQTYDALRLSAKPLDTLQLDYAWVSNTRRIFGPAEGTPPAALISDHHLFNAKWTASKAFTAGGYLYALDFADAAALSSQTVGGYLLGEFATGDITLDYRLEAARQSDAGDNPNNYDADYRLLSAGIKIAGIRLGVAQEVLGADDTAGVAVQTPLATLHAFQGWSDKFLSTPGSGIKNNYVSLGGSTAGINLLAVWHEYKSDVGSADLGTELNLQASKRFAKLYTVTLKYADYQADTFSTDTKKLWLMAEASF